MVWQLSNNLTENSNTIFLGGSCLNSCGCLTAKSKTPPQETIFFYPLAGTELVSQPSLTARDRDLVSVPEIRIEPGDLNPRPLTPQSVTLPTLPRAGYNNNNDYYYYY